MAQRIPRNELLHERTEDEEAEWRALPAHERTARIAEAARDLGTSPEEFS